MEVRGQAFTAWKTGGLLELSPGGRPAEDIHELRPALFAHQGLDDAGPRQLQAGIKRECRGKISRNSLEGRPGCNGEGY